jgi:F0F1-type ATP synthase membrane subunit b/b'
MDATLVVLISFIIFLGLAYRLGYRQAMQALDGKIAKIRQALQDAAQAKEAALQALHQERRYHEEVQEEIELITKRTEEQTLLLRQHALQDINKMISARQQTAENMIKRVYDDAIQKIQAEATAKTIASIEAIVKKKFSSSQKEALNDMAIAQISTQLTKHPTTRTTKTKRLKTKRSVSR